MTIGFIIVMSLLFLPVIWWILTTLGVIRTWKSIGNYNIWSGEVNGTVPTWIISWIKNNQYRLGHATHTGKCVVVGGRHFTYRLDPSGQSADVVHVSRKLRRSSK